MIHLKGEGKTAEALCKAVEEKLLELDTRVRAQKKAVLHISNFYGEATKEEIVQAMADELGQVVLNTKILIKLFLLQINFSYN